MENNKNSQLVSCIKKVILKARKKKFNNFNMLELKIAISFKDCDGTSKVFFWY